ncbi:MAG: hypothetical protein WC495_00020 [Patescibacteria group bacterium]
MTKLTLFDKKPTIIIVVAFASLFFAALHLFFSTNENQSISPDEKANYTFTQNLVNTENIFLKIDTEGIDRAMDLFKPRSITYSAENQSYRLSSFYGLPFIYSFFQKFLPRFVIYCLFPIIGIIAFWLILEKSFLSFRAKFYSLIVFAFHPLFVLYAARSYMHNLLFFNLFLLAIVLILYAEEQKPNLKRIFFIVSGLVYGFSLATRTTELVWSFIFIVLLFTFLEQDRFIFKLQHALLFVLGSMLVVLPFIGISYTTSHSLIQYRILNPETLSQTTSFFALAKSYIFPFGVDVGKSASIFFDFFISLWWLTLPGLVGLVLLARKAFKNGIRTTLLFIGGLLLCFYLILIYGPYPQESSAGNILIGNSHFRYWIPIFLMLSYGFGFFVDFLQKHFKWFYLYLIIPLGMFSYSIYFIFFTSGGLVDIYFQNVMSARRLVLIEETTESNSILLAGLADKYFFPDRVVAGTLMHEQRSWFVDRFLQLQTNRSVYYYHIDADISSHFTKDALEAAGVEFTYVAQFWDGGNAWEYLYKLDWPNKNGNE